jgi:hypothetical protein
LNNKKVILTGLHQKVINFVLLIISFMKIMEKKDRLRGLMLWMVILITMGSGTILTSQAQSRSDLEEVKRRLISVPEVYISIASEDFIKEIALQVSVDFEQDGRVFLYVSKKGYDHLISRKIPFKLEPSPGYVDFALNMLQPEDLLLKSSQNLTWDFYPTYEAYVALMKKFEDDFPGRVKIHEIGKSVMGRSLLFAQIGADVDNPRPVPQVMYSSTMHGDETAGFVILLRMIYHLASGYGADEEITELLNKLDIWICPNENPDGTYTQDNATVNGATRSNANGKDLNRNYPGPHPNYLNPPDQPIQPETQAMMDFVSSHNFVLSANIHGGAELVNFPFDAWVSAEQKHADHEWWKFISYEFADTVHHRSPSGYFKGMGDGVTHGGDWYVVYGSRQDYMNFYHSIREFTLEISNQKLLNPAQLPAHWDYQHRSLINYFKQATYGFHGIVKDAESGTAVQAEIKLLSHDQLNSEVRSSLPFGYFSRPVISGNYDLQVSSGDYPIALIPGVDINNFERMSVEIQLGENPVPLYVYSADPAAGFTYGTGSYPSGYTATVKAFPGPGYAFSHWRDQSGDTLSLDQAFQVEVTQSATYHAWFDTSGYIVDFSSGTGAGIVTAYSGTIQLQNGQRVEQGAQVQFTALPMTGYQISSWKVNGQDIDLTSNVFVIDSILANVEVRVNFTGVEYQLMVSVSDPAAGNIVVEPDRDKFFFGEDLRVIAVPAAGFLFDSWRDNENETVSENDEYAFSMPARDVYLVANFRIPNEGIVVGESGLLIYPNPAMGRIFIKTTEPVLNIDIIDIRGRILLQRQYPGIFETAISLEGIASGLYLLRVYNEGGAVVQKFRIH